MQMNQYFKLMNRTAYFSQKEELYKQEHDYFGV